MTKMLCLFAVVTIASIAGAACGDEERDYDLRVLLVGLVLAYGLLKPLLINGYKLSVDRRRVIGEGIPV